MSKPLSYCQLEFDCLYSDLISHDSEGEYSRMAPFRILSFDIECAGRKGHFPEAKHDPVIQVANHVTIQGEHQPFICNVITLKSCAPIEGVDVISFETERAVLLAWRDLVIELAEDIGAAPVWVFNNGISHHDQVETESVMPFVQEAIDGIEFARGDSNSTWGSVRAAMGHPEPFELKYLAVGNEDCNKTYYRG